MNVRAFSVTERWGFVRLWWGDIAKADDAQITNLPWTEEDHQRT